MARFSRLPIPREGGGPRVTLLAVHVMGAEGVAPFIYFQFLDGDYGESRRAESVRLAAACTRRPAIAVSVLALLIGGL